MIFPGMRPPKTVVQEVSQPKLVERVTGQIYVLVRDDTAVNGKLYIAPIGMMTSMRSIKPEVLKEDFEWYVEPRDRPVPASETEVAEINSVPLTEESVEVPAPTPKKSGGRPLGSKDKKKRKRVKRKT